jgi:hypothetical protein
MKIKIPLSVTILVDYDVTDAPDSGGSPWWMATETAEAAKALILDHMTSDETVDRLSDTVGWCINSVSVSVD